MPRDLEVLARAAQGVPALTLKDSVESPRDLLVIGTGRRWPAGGVVRGSHGAACPVVVVPRPELARAAGGRMAARQMLREAAEILENSRGFTR
nr:hypothetical protein [Actinoplanes polyasparticus]